MNVPDGGLMSDIFMAIAAVSFIVSVLAFAVWAGDHLRAFKRRRKDWKK